MGIDHRYKERCREAAIQKREETFECKENERLVTMHRRAQHEKLAKEQEQVTRKAELYEDLRKEAADRSAKKKEQDALNLKREQNIREKEEERKRRAAEQAKALKVDSVAISHQIVNTFTAKTIQGDDLMVGQAGL